MFHTFNPLTRWQHVYNFIGMVFMDGMIPDHIPESGMMSAKKERRFTMATKTTLLLALVLFSSVATAGVRHFWEGRINWGQDGEYATIECGTYAYVIVTEKGVWCSEPYGGPAPSAFYAVATLYDSNNDVIATRTAYVEASPEGYEPIGSALVWTHFFDFCTVPFP